MKYFIIKDCKTCPNKHLDHRYSSCHRRDTGWYCSLTNNILLSIPSLDIKELPENVIPDWCPLDNFIEKE